MGKDLLADGIYFGLSDVDHNADPAIGSTRMKLLAKNAFRFWWRSEMNPLRKREKDTPAKIRGKAMHCVALEGVAKFKLHYMKGPYSDDDDLTGPEKATLTKDAKKKAEARGLMLLKADEYDRILTTSQMIEMNPDLRTVFKNGYPEVSIFWTKDGMRKKARFDYFKIGGIGDMKTLDNWADLPFEDACLSTFRNDRWDIQAAHYFDAFARMRTFVMDGKVYGADRPSMDWLYEAATAKDIGFQWVAVSASEEPSTWSKAIRPANPLIADNGRSSINLAEENYRLCMAEFGTQSAWITRTPVTEITKDDFRYGYNTQW